MDECRRLAARAVDRRLILTDGVIRSGWPNKEAERECHMKTASSSQKSEWGKYCHIPCRVHGGRGVLSSEHDWRSGLSGFKRAEYRKGSRICPCKSLITRFNPLQFFYEGTKTDEKAGE